MSVKYAALVGALSLLGACAHLPATSDGLTYEQRRSQLETLSDWDMRGRIAVETPDDAFQGRFDWLQTGDRMRLQIRNPLRVMVVQIAGTKDAMTVRSRRDTWVLKDAEAELSDLLGWWLPVTSLDSWLKGLPDQSYPSELALDGDTVKRLDQRAWKLDYQSYQLLDGMLVPRSIAMTYERLRLVVTVDSFGPTSTDAQNPGAGSLN